MPTLDTYHEASLILQASALFGDPETWDPVAGIDLASPWVALNRDVAGVIKMTVCGRTRSTRLRRYCSPASRFSMHLGDVP
ncbi:MAG: hypothetical protein RLZZ245_2116 [Verrucomicrobiota bacterium]